MEMTNSKSLKKRFGTEQHRAVAPIIATLLMVAIAVVGGVLIYVYTQGFFSSTSSSSISTDVLSMTGYDAKSGTVIYDGTAPAATCTAETSPTAGKSAGECVTIHIKNAGGSTLAISNIKVDGVGAVRGTTLALASGQWGLYEPGIDAGTDATMAAGQESTIIYKFLGTGPTQDSTFSVDVTTKAGGQFTFKLTEGQRK